MRLRAAHCRERLREVAGAGPAPHADDSTLPAIRVAVSDEAHRQTLDKSFGGQFFYDGERRSDLRGDKTVTESGQSPLAATWYAGLQRLDAGSRPGCRLPSARGVRHGSKLLENAERIGRNFNSGTELATSTAFTPIVVVTASGVLERCLRGRGSRPNEPWYALQILSRTRAVVADEFTIDVHWVVGRP